LTDLVAACLFITPRSLVVEKGIFFFQNRSTSTSSGMLDGGTMIHGGKRLLSRASSTITIVSTRHL
jgi:hypothetical protein